jgi:hypothetical protein
LNLLLLWLLLNMPATISHALSMTTPDDPAYENQPKHWNSNHNFTLNASGSEISGAFGNGGGVTFGLSADGKVTASAPGAAASPVNFSAGTTSSNLGSVVFADSNGLAFGLNGSTITGSYTQSTHSHRTEFLAMTLGGNTSGTTTFNASNNDTIFLNGGNNITLSGNGSTITISAAAQTNQSAIKAFGATNTGNTAGNTGVSTGIDWVMAGTNNVTISESTAVGGPNTLWVSGAPLGALSAGVSNLGNTAGSTGTVSTGNFVLVGSNGITLSQSTGAAGSAATITISGDGFTLSSYEPIKAFGMSTSSAAMQPTTSGVVSVFPFVIEQYVSVGVLNMLFSANFTTVGTSSGLQTAGIAMALYTRNVSTLSSIKSNSFSWQVSGNNSSYTINQVTATSYTGYGATAATNSAGSNISSGYTGVKIIGFPINSLLSPGNYWIGLVGTNSTSSNNVGMTLGYMGGFIATALTAGAPIGSFSSAYTSGQDPLGGRWIQGLGVWTSAGSVTNVPVSMNFASISASSANSIMPYMRFWST